MLLDTMLDLEKVKRVSLDNTLTDPFFVKG
jgi:hypothetical protein